MDKGYEKERFVSLSIKSSVARKFRRFCKRKRASQSMALLSMLDFFEINGVSPEDRLGETITSLKRQIKQRFNAVVAIIRAVEK
ncbi:BfmA/BtgA family mobilization protein, partial [Galbibacter sp. EGI 63066]|uniref:BfmA/BtgA family mobilization protein n=1 Tax=Galbibacter sp. EGI 63066 TaxID=2993559 RepID=UPI002248A715